MRDCLLLPILLLVLLMTLSVHCRNEYQRKLLNELLEKYESVYRPDNVQNESSPMLVKVSIVLESFGNFDTFNMDFSFNIIFRKFWTDGRLKIANSSLEDKLVLDDIAKKLWTPKLYFPQSVGKVEQMVNSELTWLSPSTGNLVHSERISVKLSCPLDLTKFPMDKQKCPIKVSAYGYSNKDMVLQWRQPESFQLPKSKNIDLSDFDIFKIQTVNIPNCMSTRLGNFSCVVAILHLKRQYTHYLINTFMPSALIVTISWIAFLVDFKSAPARISLGLLSILSLITQYTITLSYTPKISYIKALDVWLFSCLAFVIVTLLEFAFINWFYRDDGRRHDYIFTILKHQFGSKAYSKPNTTEDMEQPKQCDNNVEDKSDQEEDIKGEQPNIGLQTAIPECAHPENKTGYKIDCLFFIFYPIGFSIFTITYWYYYF